VNTIILCISLALVIYCVEARISKILLFQLYTWQHVYHVYSGYQSAEVTVKREEDSYTREREREREEERGERERERIFVQPS